MKDVVYKNKILIICFCIVFVIFLFSAVISQRGILGDIPTLFAQELVFIEEKKNFLEFLFTSRSPDCRYFSYKLQLFLFYMFIPFFQTLKQLLAMYTISNLVMPFLGIFFNFYIASRTKRYDIAVYTLLYYSFFEIPYISWMVRESHMAVIIEFIWLQYFLTKEKLKLLDKFIIVSTFIFLLSSFENIVPISFILFLFSFLYWFKDKYNFNKLYFAIANIFIVFFIPIYIWEITPKNFNDIAALGNSIDKWIHYVRMLPDSTLNSCFLISIMGLLLCFVVLFVKRNLNFKDIIWIGPIFIYFLYDLYKKTALIPNPPQESNLFMYCMIIMPIFFFAIVLFDYLNIKVSQYFLSNLLIIACITGCFHFLWQINSSYYCFLYVQKMKEKISVKNEVITRIHFEEWEKGYSHDESCCTFARSVVLSDSYEIKKVLLGDKEHRDYNAFYEDKIVYDPIQNTINSYKVNGKYWDLTKIKDEIIKKERASKSEGNN